MMGQGAGEQPQVPLDSKMPQQPQQAQANPLQQMAQSQL